MPLIFLLVDQDTEKGATDEISQPTAQPTTVDEPTTETATAGSVSPTTHPGNVDSLTHSCLLQVL